MPRRRRVPEQNKCRYSSVFFLSQSSQGVPVPHPGSARSRAGADFWLECSPMAPVLFSYRFPFRSWASVIPRVTFLWHSLSSIIHCSQGHKIRWCLELQNIHHGRFWKLTNGCILASKAEQDSKLLYSSKYPFVFVWEKNFKARQACGGAYSEPRPKMLLPTVVTGIKWSTQSAGA